MEIDHPQVARAVELVGAGRDAEALPILARLAGEGNGEALFFLGDAYWRGIGAPQDYGRGRELFRQSAERGHPMAVRAYTNLLGSGIAGPRDWQGALKRLREEARGDALIFRSVQPDGSIDRMSEHAGLPVTKGTKYLGSRWIRPHRHTA